MQVQVRILEYSGLCCVESHGLHCSEICSIVDTTGTQLAVLYTVEPFYRGHPWDPAGCPVYSGTSL